MIRSVLCPWCQPRHEPRLATVRTAGGSTLICAPCAEDYEAWVAEERARYHADTNGWSRAGDDGGVDYHADDV